MAELTQEQKLVKQRENVLYDLLRDHDTKSLEALKAYWDGEDKPAVYSFSESIVEIDHAHDVSTFADTSAKTTIQIPGTTLAIRKHGHTKNQQISVSFTSREVLGKGEDTVLQAIQAQVDQYDTQIEQNNNLIAGGGNG